MKKTIYIYIILCILFGESKHNNFVQILPTSKVEIYSAYFWAPCKEAKSLLRSRGIDYTVKNVTFSKKTANEMRERTQGKESLPQIFVDDKYFGGLLELKEYFKAK